MEKLKVLIADDSLTNQEFFTNGLAGRGIIILQALTQEEVRGVLCHHTDTNLIVLDTKMPIHEAALEESTANLARWIMEHPQFTGLLVPCSNNNEELQPLLAVGCTKIIHHKKSGPAAVLTMLGLNTMQKDGEGELASP